MLESSILIEFLIWLKNDAYPLGDLNLASKLNKDDSQ